MRTKEELYDEIVDVWDTYKNISCQGLTSEEMAKADDIIAYLGFLIKEDL